jgi:hypothetical protein
MSLGWVAGLLAAAPPDTMVKFCWRRGHDHGEGLGHWRARGDTADSDVGTTPAQRHQRVRSATEQPNGGAAQLRRVIARTTGQQTGN